MLTSLTSYLIITVLYFRNKQCLFLSILKYSTMMLSLIRSQQKMANKIKVQAWLSGQCTTIDLKKDSWYIQEI